MDVPEVVVYQNGLKSTAFSDDDSPKRTADKGSSLKNVWAGVQPAGKAREAPPPLNVEASAGGSPLGASPTSMTQRSMPLAAQPSTSSQTITTPRRQEKPFVIGVAGGTASGKTTVCDLIIQRLHDQCCLIINQDSFYKVLTPEESDLATAGEYNFDVPEAFDEQLLLHCIDTLIAGQSYEVPIYDFTTHSRSSETRRVDPADVLIVEGILVLHSDAVKARMDMKVFVDTDDDVRLARRIQRDVAERGRDIGGVIKQYTLFVKPSFDEFISPTRRVADIIIPWARGDNLVAVDLIVEHLKAKLQKHSLCKAFENLHVIPSNFQIRGMHTVIRDVTTSRDKFVFMADRLNRIVVETALGLLPYKPHTVMTPTNTPYTGVQFERKVCGVSVIRSGESMEKALRTCVKGIDIGKILIHRRHHSMCGISGTMFPSHNSVTSPGGLGGATNGQSGGANEADGPPGENGRPSISVFDLPRSLPDDLVYEKLPSDIADRHVLLMDPVLGTGNSVSRAIEVLLSKGVQQDRILVLTIIAAPFGLNRVCRRFPQLKIITTEIDQEVDANLRVVPGVGEFGDRYFTT